MVPAFAYQERPAIVMSILQNGGQLLDKSGQLYTWKNHQNLFYMRFYANTIHNILPHLQKLTDAEIGRLAHCIIPRLNCNSLSDAHTEFLVRAYRAERAYSAEPTSKSIVRMYGPLPKPWCPKVVSALADIGISCVAPLVKAEDDNRKKDLEIKTLQEQLTSTKALLANALSGNA